MLQIKTKAPNVNAFKGKECFFFGVTDPGSDFFGENQHLLKACNTKHVKKSSSLVVSSPPTEAAK